MFRTKLIKHLRHFTRKEMDQFGHFLASPFFFRGRTEAKMITLFKFLKRFHPAFDHKKLAKEKVFPIVFKDKDYDEQQLQQLMI